MAAQIGISEGNKVAYFFAFHCYNMSFLITPISHREHSDLAQSHYRLVFIRLFNFSVFRLGKQSFHSEHAQCCFPLTD